MCVGESLCALCVVRATVLFMCFCVESAGACIVMCVVCSCVCVPACLCADVMCRDARVFVCELACFCVDLCVFACLFDRCVVCLNVGMCD